MGKDYRRPHMLLFISTTCIASLLLLLISSQAFATFSLSGSEITQSGTDTDLSELGNVTDVTTSDIGGVTYYNIGTRQLDIEGNLSVDGRTERVVSSHSSRNFVFRVDGTLTINDFEDKNGDTTYLQDVVFHSTYSNSFCCGNYGFRVSPNGTLIMNGGYIRSDSSPLFETNSRLEIINGGFITNTNNNVIQIRFFCDDFNINGFFVKNFKLVVGRNQLASSFLSGLDLFGGGLAASGTLRAGSEYIFEDFISRGTETTDGEVEINDYNHITFINAVNGSDLTVEGVINNNRATGLYRNYKRVKGKIENENGDAIEDAIVFIRDTDNGERQNWVASNIQDDVTSINFIDDRTYTETTNTLGETNEFDVLLSVLARPTGNFTNAPNQGSNTQDIRGKQNDSSDLLIFIFGHIYTSRKG